MSAASDMPSIARHYDTGPILERIREGLRIAGADPVRPAAADLKGVDEFHIGGVEATAHLLDPLRLTASTKVVDLGSGIGGTARFVAETYGATVTGVDLTPAFVEVANELSAMCGLSDKTRFVQGSALQLPLKDGCADVATMLHVGMNIADKPGLMSEVARVLAPGGRFALFDVMRRVDKDLSFPVPWASEASQSYVDWPQAYRDAAAQAGLELIHEEDRNDYAKAFFQKVIAAMEETGGPPPVGLPLIMGENAQEKYSNAVAMTMQGLLGPCEMVFSKPR